jgi:hypothetical protein
MNTDENTPKPEVAVALRPADFTEIFKDIPSGWVLIGGQAVALWATRYKLSNTTTSKDIDFWGSATKLKDLAIKLNTAVLLPHKYDRTWLSGAVKITAAGQKTSIELLREVAGLDEKDVTQVAIEFPVDEHGTKIPTLTPVSLVLTKLYALRHFNQTERNDLKHLEIAIKASREFLAEAAQNNVKFCLWNCNRIITAYKVKQHQQMEKQHGFRLLKAVPVETIRQCSQNTKLPDHQKLANFLDNQWARTVGQAAKAASGAGDEASPRTGG